ncbi:MAG: hypothetical protein CMH75_04895 [Nitrospina sp.]|nr:hypothetical protein [Nitrospina sp.]|tara:strand:- start:4383 stop:5078 length:696 start_codon:yes stop_codon:yes gene_type:complete
MSKPQILDYWLKFFQDLFLGTLKKLFIFCFVGLGVSVLSILTFDAKVLDISEWNSWLESSIFILASLWYLGIGILHSLIACVLNVMIQKLKEGLEGLQQLLDWLTREVIGRIPKLQKNIPRSELEKKYDQVGNELKTKLKQKSGFTSFFSGVLFGVILKVLKFLFLDQIVEELQKKESSQITSTDIEHAVRRVGTEVMISPITDNLFLVHAVNIALGILFFGMPFALLWII